jgi:hypothetical protein
MSREMNIAAMVARPWRCAAGQANEMAPLGSGAMGALAG